MKFKNLISSVVFLLCGLVMADAIPAETASKDPALGWEAYHMARSPVDKRLEKRSDNITQGKIGKLLREDGSLSYSAQKVKVSTSGGVTTIRGEVETEAERERVTGLVGTVVNPASMRNEMRVKRRY